MRPTGITDYLSDAPKMEFIVWGLTLTWLTLSILQFRRQLRNAGPKVGDIKPGSTGPPIWTSLAVLGQMGGFLLPQLIYWTTTANNGFRQPEWMAEYALPSPPDIFGVDGVLVGRAVGLLAHYAGSVLMRTTMKTLGDQYHLIGVSALFFHGLPETYILPGLQIREKPRLVDHGPLAYVRHPAYTQVSHSLVAEPRPF